MSEKKDLSYIDATKLILKKAKFPLKTTEIWKEIVNENLDKRLKSIGKTPDRTLHTVLLFYTRNKEVDIFIFSENPRRFWLRNRKDELENSQKNSQKENLAKKIQQNEEKTKRIKFSERDLHPLFVKSLYESEFNALAKTVYHETSKVQDKGINKWLHPDLVAVRFLYEDFKDQQTVKLMKNLNKLPYKIYSFELKISLNSNFKEYYFQALSNSSWANEGYLVIFDDSIDEDKFEELERLNQSFGIGLIKFGVDIADFQVLLRAREKELDLRTVDKLSFENKNFSSFIKNINDKIQTQGQGFELKLQFDEIFSDERLERYLKEKQINKKE